MSRTTPRHTRSVASGVTVSRRIDAPVDAVWALLADVHEWPRWSSLTDICTSTRSDQPELAHPIRLGRHRLRVAVSPDTPFQLRSSLASAPNGALHPALVTLSPTELTDRQRDVFNGLHRRELSPGAIGAELGMNANATHQASFRARRNLRMRLEAEAPVLKVGGAHLAGRRQPAA